VLAKQYHGLGLAVKLQAHARVGTADCHGMALVLRELVHCLEPVTAGCYSHADVSAHKVAPAWGPASFIKES